MSTKPTSLLRCLPAVDELLKRPAAQELAARLPAAYLSGAARRLLSGWREAVLAGELVSKELEALVARADRELESLVARELEALPRRVINATGVVVHTNLGRAPWPEKAARRALEAATRPSNLEYDLATGTRGKREAALAKAQLLFPDAEAVLAVNNCAAAVLLALNTLCEGREVVISRGELVEIGGSFRIPDVLEKSGAVLREVGTTNRTHLADFERALNERTAALLRVHPSNYRIVGFSTTPETRELVELAHRKDLWVIEDLGSGLVEPLAEKRPAGEPAVAEALAAGVDVLMFSGDKLLGGPQAGVILGRAKPLERMRRNPLYRALRPDKVTLAALDACWEIYLTGSARDEVPVLSALSVSAEVLEERAGRVAAELAALEGIEARVVPALGAVGGGAAPLAELQGHVVALRAAGLSTAALEQRLRRAEIPVIVRVEADRVLLDLRTVAEDEEKLILAAVGAALG